MNAFFQPRLSDVEAALFVRLIRSNQIQILTQEDRTFCTLTQLIKIANTKERKLAGGRTGGRVLSGREQSAALGREISPRVRVEKKVLLNTHIEEIQKSVI